ncbi:MAG: hypothetical protein M1833_004387 [Piccolia ochrophora]|nr:MAG: hypothetical protein M1833_004387 [Piccolia ochrophora]
MTTGIAKNEDLKASTLFSVADFSAVVTGGGTGIGLMITQALVANGARVYITGRRQEALDTVVKQYSSGPGKIIAISADISKKDDVQRLAGEVASKEPQGLHLLVNNAGIARDDNTKHTNAKPDFSSAQSISDYMMQSEFEQWQDTFTTNVAAQYFVAAAFLPQLAKARESSPGYTSSIVNVASISGVMKGSSMGQFAYASSKAALIHLTRMMATTFTEAKIRVNCIAPGLFPSEMTAGESDENQKNPDLYNKELSNPAGRPGNDSDMGACILYLAGPGGLFLNGQVIYPDGGEYIVSLAGISEAHSLIKQGILLPSHQQPREGHDPEKRPKGANWRI